MKLPSLRSLFRTTPVLAALAAVAAVPAVTVAQVVPSKGAATMDLSDVKVGAKGYGLTVFKGMTPEKFDVEVVGILHHFRPNQDLILIKTPHERLNIAHTVGGMSGSPIFLDGKMIGAYAYGWQFGAEPIAGVTPIKNMLEDQARPIPADLPKLFLPSGTGTGGKSGTTAKPKHAMMDQPRYEGVLEEYDLRKHAKQVGGRVVDTLKAPAGSGLASASNPVLMSGLTERSANVARDLLAPMGLDAMAGGGGSNLDPNAPTKYEDGGAVGVQLVRGDISMMGLGTVTRVDGDRLVAFGHPMLQGGLSLLPTTIGKIHWIMASQARSFKIGESARPLGAMVNDQQASIVVDQTMTAPTFPVVVDVEGVDGPQKKHWDLELAHDRFMSPSFVAVAIGNTVESTVSERRDATWHAVSKIYIKGYGSIELNDFGLAIGGTPSSDDFIRAKVVRAVAMILNNPFEVAQIEKVETKVKISFGRDLLTLRGTQLLEDKIDAGHKARVELTFRVFGGGEEKRTIEIPMPKELAGRDVDIELVPGWADGPELSSPDSLAALISNIPRLNYAPDSLMAVFRHKDPGVVFHGQVAKQLPPSVLDTLRSSSDSVAPDAIPSTVRIPFPMGKLVDGRDRVRVKVREVLR